jgi:hypothetical protein
MTQEQREKLWYIAGQIEGLAWGVEDPHINEGLNQAVEMIGVFLEEDKQSDD